MPLLYKPLMMPSENNFMKLTLLWQPTMQPLHPPLVYPGTRQPVIQLTRASIHSVLARLMLRPSTSYKHKWNSCYLAKATPPFKMPSDHWKLRWFYQRQTILTKTYAECKYGVSPSYLPTIPSKRSSKTIIPTSFFRSE